jgi:hypothetical protein
MGAKVDLGFGIFIAGIVIAIIIAAALSSPDDNLL